MSRTYLHSFTEGVCIGAAIELVVFGVIWLYAQAHAEWKMVAVNTFDLSVITERITGSEKDCFRVGETWGPNYQIACHRLGR